MTKTEEFLSPMARVLERNALKYQVGHTMFCPACQTILDCKRAVGLDWLDANEELRGTRVVCAACYDAKMANGKLEKMTEGTAFHVKVNDGRVLFSQTKRARKQ
jgi:hypothetical protein